jgi:hypothetical protein
MMKMNVSDCRKEADQTVDGNHNNSSTKSNVDADTSGADLVKLLDFQKSENGKLLIQSI